MQPNPNPDIERHTEILCGYLNNLSLKDFTTISLALEKCWHASQNLGVSSQNICDQAFHETVSSALRNMLPCDLEKIERQIALHTSEPAPASLPPRSRKP